MDKIGHDQGPTSYWFHLESIICVALIMLALIALRCWDLINHLQANCKSSVA
jgi:hypothetical protein